eukprot:m.315534 g.315534  ORF g.315534 m.315534 type:complete len:341 (-) comp20276_c1_seq35:169-1191(-)
MCFPCMVFWLSLKSTAEQNDAMKTGIAGAMRVRVNVPNNEPLKLVSSTGRTLHLKFLPPVELRFALPAGYPSQDPPEFQIVCKWLSLEQKQTVRAHLLTLYKDACGGEILYTWVQALQDESFCIVGMTSTIHTAALASPRVACTCSDGATADGAANACACGDASSSETRIVEELVAYDQHEQVKEFNNQYFECGICFTTKLGKDCLKLLCSHVWCKECLGMHFESKIADGSVRQLQCPNTACSKQANPADVKDTVSDASFKKYEESLLEVALAEMDDVIRCPRPACQKPVIFQAGSRMGNCATCMVEYRCEGKSVTPKVCRHLAGHSVVSVACFQHVQNG